MFFLNQETDTKINKVKFKFKTGFTAFLDYMRHGIEFLISLLLYTVII